MPIYELTYADCMCSIYCICMPAFLDLESEPALTRSKRRNSAEVGHQEYDVSHVIIGSSLWPYTGIRNQFHVA